MITVGLIGLGTWGKQLLRLLEPRCHVKTCCNQADGEEHRWLRRVYPDIQATFSYDSVVSDPDIEAVIIATPIATHSGLAKTALERGKDVFVEKPLSTSVDEARQLEDLAEQRHLILFTGHIFLYHPIFQYLKSIATLSGIRDVVMSYRKCGTFHDSIYWNLLSHDVSTALSLFDELPCEVALQYKAAIITPCDFVSCGLWFSHGRRCHISINRCSLEKAREVIVKCETGETYLWVGSSLHRMDPAGHRDLAYSCDVEPLAVEVDAFLACIRSRVPTISSGTHGVNVVKVISRLLESGAEGNAASGRLTGM
jgi:predicted dehydrogenase